MRMKKIAIFLTALSLVVASVFSFTASAIIYQHPNQTIESDRKSIILFLKELIHQKPGRIAMIFPLQKPSSVIWQMVLSG